MVSVTVPLLDLKAQYATIREDVLAAVAEVLESQVCIGGPKVSELEQKVAALSGCKHAVGVSSGTDALLCTFMAMDLKPGDEIVTTPFTFFATAGSIVRAGSKPVFVDIDPKTYNIDPALIERAITARTKAVMPVHLFGQMCQMDEIMQVAKKHGLSVIEDAAQAISATYKTARAGSFGLAGCLSFYPAKNLGAAGDAGMVVTNDDALYERLLLMRENRAKPKYIHRFVGGNFRLDPLQAAILLVKLPYLAQWSEARRRNAMYYNERFANSPIGVPYVLDECQSIYNQYVIRVSRRDELIEHLKAQGVGHEIYYPVPLHLQECFRGLGYHKGDFPQAEKAAEEVLAIPICPELTPDMRAYVADRVLEFCCETIAA